MYNTVTGDLIELAKQGEFDAIVHGCNCFHAMGGGIARIIAEEFPEALLADKTLTDYGDYLKLGGSTIGHQKIGNRELMIFNAYTQFRPSDGRGPYDSNVPVDYNALACAFRGIIRYDDKKLKIGFPLIGAGLAGGDWDIISDIIKNEVSARDNIHEWTLVKLEGA